MKLRLMYAGLLLLVLSMPVLLYMQLEVGEKKLNMEPPALLEMMANTDDKLLQRVLTQVLWDKDRGVIKQDANQSSAEVSRQGDTSWNLIATSRLGERAMAVVRVGDGIRRIEEGEALPDGAILVEVLHNGIKFERDDVVLNVYLFGKSQGEENENESN